VKELLDILGKQRLHQMTSGSNSGDSGGVDPGEMHGVVAASVGVGEEEVDGRDVREEEKEKEKEEVDGRDVREDMTIHYANYANSDDSTQLQRLRFSTTTHTTTTTQRQTVLQTESSSGAAHPFTEVCLVSTMSSPVLTSKYARDKAVLSPNG